MARGVRPRAAGLSGLAALLAAAGCHLTEPDPRNFTVLGLPPAAPDVRSAARIDPPRPAEPAAPLPKLTTPGPLQLPAELPGADTPPVPLPPLAGMPPAERNRVIRDRFPALPPLGADPLPPAAGPPLTLPELEQIGLSHNPAVQQAAANVEAARGRAIQDGLLPNPALGFQADQLGTGNGITRRGQPGGYVEWVIKTAGKVRLSRLVAVMDYLNAHVALKRAQIDVAGQVRLNYFGVLVARQQLAVTTALARFSEEIYRAQLGLVQGGEQAPYEPLQSYVQAVQARGLVVQARNRYTAAWRQLAAALGRPDLPPAAVAGRADAPAPDYSYEQLRDVILENHTELATAENLVLQARYRVKQAAVAAVPDISTHVYFEQDFTTPPFRTQVGVQAGGAIPVFDRNQGGRLAAQAHLARALLEVPRVRNDLLGRLATAYEQYSSSKELVGLYRDQAIPNQVRVYRGTYQRFLQDGTKVGYTDVVVAQTQLGATVAAYLSQLQIQWQAVAELATLAQLPELYLDANPPPAPSLEESLGPPRPAGVDGPPKSGVSPTPPPESRP